MKIRHGCTRTVIIIGRYAIKLPILRHGWRSFVAGLLANMREEECWYAHNVPEYELKNRHLLCPVLFGWAGFILIQPRCEENLSGCVPKIDYISDRKVENCGFYEGRLVIFDYGN